MEEDTLVPKDQDATAPIAQTFSKPSSNTIPFPQRLRKQNLDKQFSKFIDIFKSLHINLSYVDMLEQMPKYANFLKEVLSKRGNWRPMRRLCSRKSVVLSFKENFLQS